MINFSKYDAIVVGCGLTGGVIARFLAEEKHKKVVIVERRNHIAGNMYDFRDDNGLIIQQYGPHTFHTTKKHLYDYVCKYSNWKEFYLTCGAEINGKFTPTPFNFQTIDDFYPSEKAVELKARIHQKYGDADKTTIVEMLNSDDPLIKEYADFLYDNDYSLYTAKQWGISPDEIDVSVLKRVPVLFSYKNGYFDDEFQMMPEHTFTDFFANIIRHENINVVLNENILDYLEIKNNQLFLHGEPTNKTVIYTGAADELLNCKYGVLPYRSLRFDYKTENTDSYQNAPVVAYPQAEGYTRITEYTKIPVQYGNGKTVIAVEYPQPYETGKTEPYYPILTEQSQTLYKKYCAELSKIPNLFMCGRLGDFKYYNMDQALERALDICNILSQSEWA